MLFNSYLFIFVFLPVCLATYFFLSRFVGALAARGWLLFASLFFYSWWNPVYLYLLGASVVLNFLLADRVAACSSRTNRKYLFAVALLFNIGLLGYFKYANFFVDSLNAWVETGWTLEKIILPLAISFFTLQQIAYQVDVYEGLVRERNFLSYALFVTFFPQLIAGPIVHHREMMPQFASSERLMPDVRCLAVGFFIFSVGLFKKVVMADSFSIWVNAGYANIETLSVLEAWVVSLSYTFQMYFDFSGYADMAIGLALLFNIRLPLNFNSPYRVTSVIHYWECWHITLSRFINTYVYTPIVRSFSGRVTYAKAMLATLLAMLVSGLWHGAAWTFVFWGFVHGVALVLNHSWRRLKKPLPTVFAWLLTFLFINFSLVIFRSGNMEQMLSMFQALFGAGATPPVPVWAFQVLSAPVFGNPLMQYLNLLPVGVWAVLALSGALLLCLAGKNSAVIQERFSFNLFYLGAQLILFFIPLLMLDRVQEFIYFNF
jgi:D-alanyl-lipoteichoic acid acyltransferase DltB (MBOAT superfamily)